MVESLLSRLPPELTLEFGDVLFFEGGRTPIPKDLLNEDGLSQSEGPPPLVGFIRFAFGLLFSKLLLSFFFVMDDFTLRLLKIVEKMILRKCVLSMLRVDQREKTNSALTSS